MIENDDDFSEPAPFPVNANGSAYTAYETRHGVPLEYVAEKLGNAIEELHAFVAHNRESAAELRGTYHSLVTAYLGLSNMLGSASIDQAERLLGSSSGEMKRWRELIDSQGDVRGLAILGDESPT
jgi:hypothetical protein